MKEETIKKISDAVREKYGKMVSVSNVIQFLFDNQIATFEGFRNYYICERFKEEREKRPDDSERVIFLDLAYEVDMSKESMRYIIIKRLFPDRYVSSV